MEAQNHEAVNALVSLALMEKVRQIFKSDETKDTFLSFPLTPIYYELQNFGFIKGEAPDSSIKLKVMADFCRLLNQIPSGIVWETTQDSYLWDTYDKILRGPVRLANSTLTVQEKKDKQKYYNILFKAGKKNKPQPSPKYNAYRRYRDAWTRAVGNLKKGEVAATCSDDPKVKDNWEQVEKPLLQAKVDDANENWNIIGFKEEVERALQIFNSLQSKSPVISWNAWSKLYSKDNDLHFDTDNLPFAVTGITPTDVLDSKLWSLFTLLRSEANHLIADAPDELRNRLCPEPVTMNMDEISFEWISAPVTRAWFEPSLFKARFWKFSDQGNGQALTYEGLPAYVKGLVLARNPVLKPDGALITEHVSVGPFTAALERTNFFLSKLKEEITGKIENNVSPGSDLSLSTSLSSRDQAKVSAAIERNMASSFKSHQGAESEPAPAKPVNTFSTTNGMKYVQPPEDRGFFILAFICKQLPRWPDYDKTLTWE